MNCSACQHCKDSWLCALDNISNDSLSQSIFLNTESAPRRMVCQIKCVARKQAIDHIPEGYFQAVNADSSKHANFTEIVLPCVPAAEALVANDPEEIYTDEFFRQWDHKTLVLFSRGGGTYLEDCVLSSMGDVSIKHVDSHVVANFAHLGFKYKRNRGFYNNDN